ncbi:HEAT repeats family protein [Lyngbya aestuarii BL J]|uniref:HEAT repeats family protein n=2 Tax=Lyngbya aestuarii BL J TaxID=1348334 RepID=U7QBK4_9CYAN|nr:HEAT repeat domain-containing protein [Lyngbya aestuarii]ERT05213.1 HEAT repeats family protein [Lyngbya aestuarii BL J]
MGDQFSNLSDDNQSPALLSQAIAQLESGDFQHRWDAAKQLAKMGTIAINPLIAILEDEEADPEVRWFVARTLGQFNSDAVVPALVNLLQTAKITDDASETSLLEMAATALANLGTSAVEPLGALLENEQLKPFATAALAQIRHSETITPLLSVVNDSNPKIRACAIEALGSFHDWRIPPVLVKALNDPSASVRKEAIIGLSRRGDLVAELNLVEQLQPLLWDIRPQVSQQAQIALSRLGTDQAVVALVEQILSTTTPLTVKLNGVRSLCWIETLSAIDQLQHILFTSLDQPTSNPSSFSIHQEIIQGLGRMSKPEAKILASQILVEFLQSQHPSLQIPTIKQLVALSLGQLGNITAFDPLVQLLADSETTVQFHCIAALKQLDSPLNSPSVYERLQQLAQHPNLDPCLKQGIAIALTEW